MVEMFDSQGHWRRKCWNFFVSAAATESWLHPEAVSGSGGHDPEIIINLAKCIIAFYSVYYIVSSVCFGAFSLEGFDGKMPFHFRSWLKLEECCVTYTNSQLADFVAMEITYFVSTWAFVTMVRSRLWDYALTVTFIHILMSCLVMLSFPVNWSWWVCLALGVFIMISIGEMVHYSCRYNMACTRDSTVGVEESGLTFYPKDENSSEIPTPGIALINR